MEFLAAEFLAGKRKEEEKQEDEKTLAEAYARYIEIKRNTLSPSTVREYTRAAKLDFPELMTLKLSQITAERVQSAVNVMSGNHSPKSVRNAHGLLSAVMKMFCPGIRIDTRLPQAKQSDIHVPIEQEIEKLIHAIRGTELEKAVLLAAFGSLRRSEVCALTSDDISGNVVSVNKALVWDGAHVWTIKQPKSKAGYRDVTFPSFVIERLIPQKDTKRIVNLVPTPVIIFSKRRLIERAFRIFGFTISGIIKHPSFTLWACQISTSWNAAAGRQTAP